MSEVEARAVSRAVRAPMTVDEQARTVEVIFSAGTRSPNYIPGLGMVLEELDMSPNAVRMGSLTGGDAPVLDTHRRSGVRDIIGRVVTARIERGRGYATLKISDADDVQPIWQRIVDGSLRHVSVGYEVRKYEPLRGSGGETVYRAVDWQPREISFCAVPVDPHAAVRSEADGAERAPAIEIITDEVPADASAQTRAAEGHPASSGFTTHHAEEASMAESPIQAPEIPAVTATAAPAVNEDAVRSAERARIVSLREAGEAAGSILERAAIAEVETMAVSEGWSADRFRAALLDKAVAGGQRVTAPTLTPVSQMGRSGDDPAAIVSAMATALAVRSMPQLAAKEADQRWREYASLRPTDMLIELAAARGERVGPRDRLKLIERSFHTTSDFPMLLENAGNKMLEAGYAAAAPSYRSFFGRRPFNDFKAHTFLTAGDFPALAELAEGGEITAGTISEKRERITPKTYARQVRITRQALINDDLGAFSDFGTMIGRRVADYENALAYALVNTATGNGPTLAEGAAAVFTTGRGNKASAGGAIAESTLDTAFAGMMGQTSLDGIKLNIQPAILLTGAAYRGAAIRYTTRIIQPDSGANVGLYSNLTPVSDANIVGNRWYLFADPAVAPVYVYGYVGGQEGPQVRVHQYVPGTDGMAVEVVHDFAVGAIDYRGGWFNPGA